MLCAAQLGGPVLKASGRVQFSPFQLADKSPMITDQHTAGGSVSQLSQLAKLSPWLTLSTKDITTSFWRYNKWFWFLSNQIMDLYHFSNPIELNLCINGERLMWTILDTEWKKELTCWACLTDLNWPQPSPIQRGNLLMRNPSGTGLLMRNTSLWHHMVIMIYTS